MKSFVFVSCFVALAIARPEAGYSYSAPVAQPPAPTYSQPALTSYQQPASGSYSDSSVVGASYSVGDYSSGGQYSSGSSYTGGSNFADTSANYNSGGSYSSGSAYSAPSTTVVQKHIYVHVPPPEQVVHRQQVSAPVVNQKHYKIIFIKAPSAPAISQQIIPQQPTNEEKTIVYVLVKKPEEIETANVVSAPVLPPSKPEVYFIKYKTQATGTSGGLISGGSAHVGGSHDAVSGISYDHSSHSHGQPSPVYGPAH